MQLSLHHGEFGRGRPLIILHGLFGSGANWKSVARRLGAAYRVILPDLRNHGASPHAESMGYEEMGADVLGLLDKKGLPRAFLLGHSLGGKVAMTLALFHPERVAAMVAVDVAPVYYQHRFDWLIETLRALPLRTLTDRAEADHLLSHSIGDARLRQFLLQNLVHRDQGFGWRIHLEAIHATMEDLLGFPDLTAGAPFLGPSLFIAGERSDYIRPEYTAAIRERFPRAEMVTIPGTGHWVHVENPQAFLAALAPFLKRAEPSQSD